MPKLSKNQTILLVVALFLILGGVIGWDILQRLKIGPEKEPLEEEIPSEVTGEEVFSLSGTVSGINTENNFLMVKPSGQEDEIKVILADKTKLFGLEYPSETGDTYFTLKRKEIAIGDLKAKDHVFIKSNVNITNKRELGDIDYIEVLP